MRPSKDDDAIVDLVDVILRDGVVLRADVIVSVAEIPLVGIKLTAVVAGMETMTDYGLFREWDAQRRKAAVSRRQYGRRQVGGQDGDEPTPKRSREAERPAATERERSGGSDPVDADESDRGE